MRTQFSSANKLARFGKIEAVITMRVMLVYRALHSHHTMRLFKNIRQALRNAPESFGHLSEDNSSQQSMLSEMVSFFEALTYIAIGAHRVSRGLEPDSPKLDHIPQMARLR